MCCQHFCVTHNNFLGLLREREGRTESSFSRAENTEMKIREEKKGVLQTSMGSHLLLSKLLGHQVTSSPPLSTFFFFYLSFFPTHVTQPSKDL